MNKDADRDEARKSVAVLNIETHERLSNMWLAELAAVTVSAKGGADDMKAKLAVYRKRLAEYPPDVVRDVLQEAGDNSKFFPAWAELRDELEKRCEQRWVLRAWV